MKKLTGIQALYATSLVAFAFTGNAHAELRAMKQQAVMEDAITPEAPADSQDDEVVVVRKHKPKNVVQRRTVVREQTEISPEADEPAQSNANGNANINYNANINTNNNSAQAQAVASSAPAAQKPSAGAQLDQGIKSKMEDVQGQFENALLKTLDRIKITVDDGAPAQGSAKPTETAVIQDNLVAKDSAVDKKDYMTVEAAPKADEEEDEVTVASREGETVATLEKNKSSERKVRLAPVLGKTMLGSSLYDVQSGMTAGIELEMDLDSNFSLALGYSYAKSTIALASGSAFYNTYQPYADSQGLQYNQNMFDLTGRLYLMPRESKVRVFGGAGLGYNLGYLNYQQNNTNSYLGNPYYNSNYNTSDYEVKSWLGILEAGANVNVSDNVSIGALFKYDLVLSSSQNTQLNNYAFLHNGYARNITQDQAMAGGSLANENFYSILGTVKVSF